MNETELLQAMWDAFQRHELTGHTDSPMVAVLDVLHDHGYRRCAEGQRTTQWCGRAKGDVMRYVKKPIAVQAWPVWKLRKMVSTGDVESLAAAGALKCITLVDDGTVVVSTLEGAMKAGDSDWIICGVAGEYYPCKAAIFAATYEPAP